MMLWLLRGCFALIIIGMATSALLTFESGLESGRGDYQAAIESFRGEVSTPPQSVITPLIMAITVSV